MVELYISDLRHALDIYAYFMLPIFFGDDSKLFHKVVNDAIFLEINLETALSIPVANSKRSMIGIMSALSSVTGLIRP